ncbi:HAD-IIIA family hydrolase [Methylobacterium persicinum]|uniref:D,D-heptose 1,7-bisphosphate phosphatase n=1 Tax=Methylobacterium persicinum TaxID=374426 RepID=A0ABU0HMF4_9HYPH|nr:HAD-IIIA family hydrolase [Methylobacterium persicinum]MDQ0443008.1 histidinol-phosphate phosphatase family protein [Methylobacterium persicinum]GJE40201.1 UTP--glucose-1-phosphate uridylyltransferase [Methylobacterium persicinum]
MSLQAVILAGGKGTRLRERLHGRPKPLVDVDGIPLLERQLRLLAQNGFSEALILVNHAADQIEDFCRRGDFGISVKTLDDGEAKGTAGAVLAAMDSLQPEFLVVYGDTLLDVDLARFWAFHEQGKATATLFLHPNDHPYDSDLVEVDGSGDIIGFHAYPHPADAILPNLVNAALYVVRRDALEGWVGAAPPLDFAKDLFPRMVEKGERLRGYISYEYIKDIGTPARLDKAVKHLRTGAVERARLSHAQRVVFFDRDGTLNELSGYIRNHASLRLLPGVADAIRRLNDAEYRVAIATNQPVIARGEATLDDLRAIHNKLETELGRHRAWLDLILFCPHHPHAGFPGEVAELKIDCNCRKPGTGLVDEGQIRLNADMSKSWFVGDSTVDMQTAQRAGLRSILVRTGEGGRDGRVRASANIIVADVPEAVRFILDVCPALQERLSPLATRIRPGDIVVIGGRAGLGKSTIAHVLAWTLANQGVTPAILQLDRFIRSASDRGTGNVLSRYDLTHAGALMQPWFDQRATTTVTLPYYDRFSQEQHPANDSMTLTPETALIIEGVPALALPIPNDRPDRHTIHRIWVTGDEAERRKRVIAAMIARGDSPEQAETTYERRKADEDSIINNGEAQAEHQLTLDHLFLVEMPKN